MAYVEIESLADLEDRASLDYCFLQGLDLRAAAIDWSAREVTRRTFFLGCFLSPEDEALLRARGAIFFPRFGELPYEPYRPALYDSAELMRGYDGVDFEASAADQEIYRSYVRSLDQHSVVEALAQRLHDWSVTDALDDFLLDCGSLFGRGLVGLMGSHQAGRATDAYAQLARLAHRLSRAGFLVVTGGGPGAMEAGNLGAFLSREPEEAIDEAIALLREAAVAGPPVPAAYVSAAQAVIRRFAPGNAAEWGWSAQGHARPEASEAGWSLSIPTWFYGHEQFNLFASHVAKLFQNSVREEGLVTIVNSGIVFAPGKAGTCEEVFTDAAQNFYALHSGEMQPMVFWPRDYWTETIPVVDCLAKLARAGGKEFIKRVRAVDTIEEIVDFLLDPPAIP